MRATAAGTRSWTASSAPLRSAVRRGRRTAREWARAGPRALRPHSRPVRENRGVRPCDVRADVRGGEDDVSDPRPHAGLARRAAPRPSRPDCGPGFDDGSVRPDIDVESATTDISTAGLGVAYHWIVFGDTIPARPGTGAGARQRIIRDYGRAIRRTALSAAHAVRRAAGRIELDPGPPVEDHRRRAARCRTRASRRQAPRSD